MMSILFVFLGLALLVAGAQFLVRGAVAAARALSVSELMIAMTIVTAGTTAPELTAILFYIAPVTVLAIGVSVYRELRHRSGPAPVG